MLSFPSSNHSKVPCQFQYSPTSDVAPFWPPYCLAAEYLSSIILLLPLYLPLCSPQILLPSHLLTQDCFTSDAEPFTMFEFYIWVHLSEFRLRILFYSFFSFGRGWIGRYYASDLF